FQFRRRLEDAAGDAGAMQHQAERQAADAGADDQDFHGYSRTVRVTLIGSFRLRERSLAAPQRGERETERDQHVPAGEREAEEAPGRLVAADQTDAVEALQQILRRPEIIDRPAAFRRP